MSGSAPPSARTASSGRWTRLTTWAVPMPGSTVPWRRTDTFRRRERSSESSLRARTYVESLRTCRNDGDEPLVYVSATSQPFDRDALKWPFRYV